MDKLKIAVIGDKQFDDYPKMKSVLDSFIHIHKGKTISMASNDEANPLAKKYASENGIDFECLPLDKDRFGAVASIVRNKEMVASADRTIVFWRGNPGTTQQAIEDTEKAGLAAYVVEV